MQQVQRSIKDSGMNRGDGFVRLDAAAAAVLEVLSPTFVRHEARPAQLAGVRQVLAHTLRVSVAGRLGSVTPVGCVHPTSLCTRSGARIGLLTSDSARGAAVNMVTEDEHPAAFRAAWPLPWERATAPVFQHRTAISGDGRHMLTHPDRFSGRGLAIATRDLDRQLRQLARDLRLGLVATGCYWYPGTAEFCFVAPLYLAGPEEALAAVIVRNAQGGYSWATALSLHTAFWNVASCGTSPRSWLHAATDAVAA